MSLSFRNVDASPGDPVGSWPYEAMVIALERGLVQDWQPIFAEIRLRPWGPVARRVEEIALDVDSTGVAALFRRATRAAREESDRRDREEVARRVRLSIRRSGLTAGQFAELIGTSASRLSTYTRGKVMPSAALLVRMERAAGETSK